MPKSLLSLLMVTLCAWPFSLYAQKQPSHSEQQQMLQEEQAFLRHMKPGLQHTQMLAVKAGIIGNLAPLESIRQSRNVAPSLSEGIVATDISPNLRLFKPSKRSKKSMPVLLYLHGGGWCFGSINSCTLFCANVAKEAQCCVVALNYRLSPEHPYPTPLTDCQEALAYVREHAHEWGGDSTRISIGGDSAGGNLALATAMTSEGLHAVIPIYPVTKLFADASASWATYASGYGDDAELLEAFCEAYARGKVQDPLVSVGLAPDSMLQKLPPVLLISAGHDVLADQGAAFAERLKSIGVRTDYHLFPTATHLFITVPGQPTAFRRAVQIVAKFL